MTYQLQLKPFERKAGFKYKIIQLTDFALHTNAMRSTQFPARKVKDSFETNESGRIYSSIEKKHDTPKFPIVDMLRNDPEFVQYIQDEEKDGYKILLAVPKAGIPVVLGKDTVDFMNSVKGKRILRRLYKNK
jgi:hypothetical protein